VAALKSGLVISVDGFETRNRVSPCVPERRQAISGGRRFTVALIHVTMTVFVLFLGFTQVYANVRALGWIGFGALLLVAPVVSLAYLWFTLKVHSLRTREKRTDPWGRATT